MAKARKSACKVLSNANETIFTPVAQSGSLEINTAYDLRGIRGAESYEVSREKTALKVYHIPAEKTGFVILLN